MTRIQGRMTVRMSAILCRAARSHSRAVRVVDGLMIKAVRLITIL
jgi:hypothetical protein